MEDFASFAHHQRLERSRLRSRTCKATRQLTEAACEAKLLSSTTVWNIKQENGRKLEKEQEQWLDNPDRIPIVFVPNASPTQIAKDTLQVQLDEVLTDSREKGQKTNTTYTATVETDEGQCFYFAARVWNSSVMERRGSRRGCERILTWSVFGCYAGII
ncbi:hypothetical protein FACS189443_6760 [Planctomycetales bacterium]|nr:hypothetical protein FACS189443_6760 [Planctomycetales bacterium]